MRLSASNNFGEILDRKSLKSNSAESNLSA